MANNYSAIPEPSTDVGSLYQSVKALKETVELLTQQRGSKAVAAVTWQDLVDQGLITSIPSSSTVK